MNFRNAAEILEHAKMAKIQLQEINGNLFVEAPIGIITDYFKQCLLNNKKTIIFMLNHHGITEIELKSFLGEDWNDYKDNPAALVVWADLIVKNRLIEQGKIPSNFTAVTHCVHCGDVFVPPSLVNGGEVLSCPWCWNRKRGLLVLRGHR